MKKNLLLGLFLISFYSFSQRNVLTNPDGTPIDIITDPNDPNDPTDPNDPIILDPPVRNNSVLNPTIMAGEVGITAGNLTISNNGTAFYNVPILVPPGINGVEPKISLQYSGQGGTGIAGENWHIGGLSKISRIPSTMYHDGIIDPVDFETNDRFAFDGQRLILKTGVYGAIGSTYETENFSTIKISLLAHIGTECFKVEYPDGSISFYGKIGPSSNFNIDWVITKWENPQGLKIVYSYGYTLIAGNGIIYYITRITYGSDTVQGINKIEFIYKDKNNSNYENNYIGGYIFPKLFGVLSQIKITGNGIPYRNYYLTHDLNSAGYERLKSIQEKTGDDTKALNPLNFTYNQDQSSLTQQITYSSKGPRFLFDISNTKYAKGDFDGDGEIDFIVDDGDKYIYKVNENNSITTLITDTEGWNTDLIHAPVKTLENNKFSNKDYFVKGGTSEVLNGETFNGLKICSYNTANNTIEVLFEKKINKYGSTVGTNSSYQSLKDNGQTYEKYLWGDFDGDKITDVIKIKSQGGLARTAFCSLNPNLSDYSIDSGTINVGVSNYSFTPDNYNGDVMITGNSIIDEGDYDGDGKTDLLLFKGAPYNKIEIYSLINGSFTLISSFNYSLPGNLGDKLTRTNYVPGSIKYKIILNDFNSDGKCDIFLPTDGKILISTGSVAQVFKEELLPSSFIRPSSPYTETYFTSDVDKDGRLDILRIKPILEYESATSYPTVTVGYTSGGQPVLQSVPHNGYKYNYGLEINLYQKTSSIRNWNNYNFSRIFKREFGGVDADPNDNNRFHQIMLPLFTRKSSSQLAGVELAVMGSDGISYINFNSHISEQSLIKKIEQINGENKSVYYKSLENGNGIYTSSSSLESYPYFNLLNEKNSKVVSEVRESGYGYFKKKQYKYEGAVFDVSGRGIQGFQSSLVTNWFTTTNDIISTVNKYDFTKNGVIKESFTKVGLLEPNYELQSSDSYVSRTKYTYNNEDVGYIDPLLPNKVFKLFQSKIESGNGLTDIHSQTDMVYNNNNNPIQSTIVIKNGSMTEQTVVSSINYDTGLNSPYLVDRPANKTTTTSIASGDISSSEELYTYDASKPNLIKEIKKRVTNSGETSEFITESMEHDSYGNILQNKISAPGLVDRITSYEYDTPTHRFITKMVDVENLVTEYSYDMSTGNVLTELLPSNPGSPLRTTNLYDKWGKIVNITDYLDKKQNYTYANTYQGILTTITGDDGSSSKVIYDKFGKKLHEGIMLSDGKWSVISTSYNIYDQPITVTQPYFDGETNTNRVWNELEYDIYGHLVKENHLKTLQGDGKITTYNYIGLITTENDGQKTKTITKNALNQAITLEETPGTQVTYTYYANGNLKTIHSSGATTTVLQDAFGRRKSLIDPSAGTYNYTYNHFGEIKTEEVLGKGITEYDLDDYGKVLEKRNLENGNISSKTNYTYDLTSKITNISFHDNLNSTNTIYKYVYDSFNRINSIEEIGSQAKFKHAFEYDVFGRAYKEQFLATNLTDNKTSERWILNGYKKGYKTKIQDMPTYGTLASILWQSNAPNPHGEALSATLGNGTVITNTYDVYGFPTQIKHDNLLNNIMTLDNEFDRVTGNLTKRSNNMFGSWTEDLSYDPLDRLTTWKDANGIQNQFYNDNGTISSNKVGNYAYTNSGKPFQVSTVTPVIPSATFDYYNSREQNITYNLFKSPVSIKELNAENIDFEYNAFNKRSVMYYGGLQPLKQDRPYRKYYSADGSMEIKRNVTNATVEFMTYIGGDGYTAPVVLKSDGTTQEYLYLHRDYQGSILGISNSNGVVLEKRMFDVWGSLIQYANSSGVTTVPTMSTGMLLDRGYTGHEHLLGVNIINMNGRIYDDKLHRFFQPDNNIQDSFNTQNFNRYAYVMNNPTKYNDPSGEFWQFFIGSLVNSYLAGYQASGGELNPFQWDSTAWTNAGLGATSFSASVLTTNYSNSYIENYNNQTSYGTIDGVEQPSFSPFSTNNIEAHNYVSNGFSNSYNNENSSKIEIQKAGYFTGDGFQSVREVVNFAIGTFGTFQTISQAILEKEKKILTNRGTLTALNKIKVIDKSLSKLSVNSAKVGWAGVILSIGQKGYDFSEGKDFTWGDAFDIALSVTLTIVAVSNPVALVGLAAYGILDAGGAFDGIKEAVGANNTLISSPFKKR